MVVELGQEISVLGGTFLWKIMTLYSRLAKLKTREYKYPTYLFCMQARKHRGQDKPSVETTSGDERAIANRPLVEAVHLDAVARVSDFNGTRPVMIVAEVERRKCLR